MNPLLFCVWVSVLGLGLAGCAGVEVYHQGFRTVCEANNSVWVLAGGLVLGSGDPAKPNACCAFRCFDDTVTPENNLSLVRWACVREHATRIGTLSNRWYTQDIVPFLCQRHQLCTSAEIWYGSSGDKANPE